MRISVIINLAIFCSFISSNTFAMKRKSEAVKVEAGALTRAKKKNQS